MTRTHRIAIALSFAVHVLVPAAAQAEIYRWVDAEGNVHFGEGIDSVPPRYRKGLRPYVPPEPVAPPEPSPIRPARTLARIPPIDLTMEVMREWSGRNRPLYSMCKEATPVRTSWDGEIRRIYGNLYTDEVHRDIAPYEIDLVVVLSREGYREGFVCWGVHGERIVTIMLPVKTLADRTGLQDFERGIAQLLAHELAHVALHAKPGLDPKDLATREHEADELGAYYYERAGYDCRTWRAVNPPDGAYATAADIKVACNLARQDARPPRRYP